MVAGLDVRFTGITRVDKTILALLIVQFIKHGHGGESGPSNRRKFIMLLPGHRQEGISPIHQFTANQWIGIDNFRKTRLPLLGM
jgi:hypothetical protein